MDETVKGRWRGNANASLAYFEFIGRDNTIISLKRNRRLTITLGCQTGNLDLFRGCLPCPNLPGMNADMEEYVGNYRGQLFRAEDPDGSREYLPCPKLPGVNDFNTRK